MPDKPVERYLIRFCIRGQYNFPFLELLLKYKTRILGVYDKRVVWAGACPISDSFRKGELILCSRSPNIGSLSPKNQISDNSRPNSCIIASVSDLQR